ncbi:hypothetical protein [Catellatospora tritici]|uniref:hypothetical protein n=1 Tax=Catellatospora tritici TaxID=2851566 RepID=UPI001C2CF2A2|nr:hypothetical protein [Catellatospora tritici]MBV1850085.1 hypothetical protein [Catellatospora tritici]
MRIRITAGRVLAVLLVAALAAAGFLGYGWHAAHQHEQAQARLLAASRQFVVDFISISAATVDQDLARVAVGATGEFADEFQRGMPTVRGAVLENKVESTGTVLRAGVVSGDADSAVVLVAADATVKNAKAPQGRVAHYRIQLDVVLDEASGAWLVSKLQFVG